MRSPPPTERVVAGLVGAAIAVGVVALSIATATGDVGAVVARELRAWRRA